MRKRTGATDLDDMIHPIVAGKSCSGFSPILIRLVVDYLVRAEFAGALELFVAA